MIKRKTYTPAQIDRMTDEQIRQILPREWRDWFVGKETLNMDYEFYLTDKMWFNVLTQQIIGE